MKFKQPDPAADTEIGEFANEDPQALYDALIAKCGASSPEALVVGGIIKLPQVVNNRIRLLSVLRADWRVR